VISDSLAPGALQRFAYLAWLSREVPQPSSMEFVSPPELRGPC
jgi:hypothetical protein